MLQRPRLTLIGAGVSAPPPLSRHQRHSGSVLSVHSAARKAKRSSCTAAGRRNYTPSTMRRSITARLQLGSVLVAPSHQWVELSSLLITTTGLPLLLLPLLAHMLRHMSVKRCTPCLKTVLPRHHKSLPPLRIVATALLITGICQRQVGVCLLLPRPTLASLLPVTISGLYFAKRQLHVSGVHLKLQVGQSNARALVRPSTVLTATILTANAWAARLRFTLPFLHTHTHQTILDRPQPLVASFDQS